MEGRRIAAAVSAALLLLAGSSAVEGGYTTTKDGTMMFRTAFHGPPTTLFTVTGTLKGNLYSLSSPQNHASLLLSLFLFLFFGLNTS